MKAAWLCHLVCAVNLFRAAFQSAGSIRGLLVALNAESPAASNLESGEKIRRASSPLALDQVYNSLEFSLESKINPFYVALMLQPHMNALLQSTAAKESLFANGSNADYVNHFLQEFVEKTPDQSIVCHALKYPLLHSQIHKNLKSKPSNYDLNSILISALLVKCEPANIDPTLFHRQIIELVAKQLPVRDIIAAWSSCGSANYENQERVVWMIVVRKSELLKMADLKAGLVLGMENFAQYVDGFLKDYIDQVPHFSSDLVSHIVKNQNSVQILYDRVCKSHPGLDRPALLEQIIRHFDSKCTNIIALICSQFPYNERPD